MKTQIIIKVVIMVMVGVAALTLPYSYYVFMRWVVCSLFCVLVYQYASEKNYLYVVVAGLGAILFNPITKIHFVKHTWSIVDIITAGIILAWIIIDIFTFNGKKESQKETST